jgi:hypothetical protein
MCPFCGKPGCAGSLSCPEVLAMTQRMMSIRTTPFAIVGGAGISPGRGGGGGGGSASVYFASAHQADPQPPRGPLPSAGMKVEDLIGWRIWRVRKGHLWSYFQDYAWMPGETSEGAPGDHDHAGIWAFKDKRRAFRKAINQGDNYVWGSVLLWGSVVEHADGYRASKARIVSIGGATRDVSRKALAELCEVYGVAMPAHVSRVAAEAPKPREIAVSWVPIMPMMESKPLTTESKPEPPWPVIGVLAFVLGTCALLPMLAR